MISEHFFGGDGSRKVFHFCWRPVYNPSITFDDVVAHPGKPWLGVERSEQEPADARHEGRGSGEGRA